MSKEDFVKIQKSVLKVNIHCDGCKQKVKKILKKIDGVYTTAIDSEQGKVTVTGNVDPAILIRKLAKSGKHAELWGNPRANSNNNQNLPTNQLKSLQFENGKGGKNKGRKGANNQPKGGQQNQQQQHLQQLQKDLQALYKLPQFKDMKMPTKDQNTNQKAVRFDLPEDDDEFDDELDDLDDEYYDDEDFEDDMDDLQHPLNKMKPMTGNGQVPNMMMLNDMMNRSNPQLMNAQKGGNGGGNVKKGGGGGGAGGNNQSQGGGGGGKNGGKNGGGANNKNGHNAAKGNNNNVNGGQKNVGMNVNDVVHAMNNHGMHGMGGPPGSAGASVGQMRNMNMPMGQMGNRPMGQMGAVPETMPGNPYNNQQPQYLAAVTNQQQALGNERFDPMVYERPPPAVNYMPLLRCPNRNMLNVGGNAKKGGSGGGRGMPIQVDGMGGGNTDGKNSNGGAEGNNQSQGGGGGGENDGKNCGGANKKNGHNAANGNNNDEKYSCKHNCVLICVIM